MAFDNDDPNLGYPENPFAAPLAVEAEGPVEPTRFSEQLNPWISIWTQPRATIRQIVDTDPQHMTVAIVMMAGIVNGIGNAFERENELNAIASVVGGTVGGIIGGLLMWYLLAWLLSITARWLGGSIYATRDAGGLRMGPGYHYLVCATDHWFGSSFQ